MFWFRRSPRCWMAHCELAPVFRLNVGRDARYSCQFDLPYYLAASDTGVWVERIAP